MANFSRRQRAGTELLAGRRRAHYLAQRLGTALREARLAAGLTQTTVARATKVSQPEISRLEAGKGSTASIETWSSVAAATGTQLAAFLEAVPGATRPRDYEHLKRQQLVADFSMLGGWQPSVEHALDQAHDRHRSVDLRLDRTEGYETAIVEIWDWFDDVGAAWRGLDAKVAAVRRDHVARELTGSNPWRVSGLIVVRATRRNRGLVREFGGLFHARFPASGREPCGPDRPRCPTRPDSCGPTFVAPACSRRGYRARAGIIRWMTAR